MGFSPLALEFLKVDIAAQVRVTDRISFLYLEYVRVYSDRTGVWAMSENDGEILKNLVQIPVGGIAVVMLGSGTSVTQAAMRVMAYSGATVVFTGGGGFPSYAAAVPLTSSARWAQAQAKLWADEESLLAAARRLYSYRFPEVDISMLEGTSIDRLRGLEGRMVRSAYQREAKSRRMPYFKRDSKASDPVNRGLNLSNSVLYGCAASVCASLAISPALGIIHRGNARAFLFDLADLFKLNISVPVAFSAAKEIDADASDEDRAAFVQRKVRLLLHEKKVLVKMFEIVTELFASFLGKTEGDVLVADSGVVPGHTNYSGE